MSSLKAKIETQEDYFNSKTIIQSNKSTFAVLNLTPFIQIEVILSKNIY
jgi:hypothetical protein